MNSKELPPATMVGYPDEITVYIPKSMMVPLPKEIGAGKNNYAEAINDLLEKVFGLDKAAREQDENLWKRWVNLGQADGAHSLRSFLTLPVRDSIKAKAVTILALPVLNLSPFYWKDQSDSNLLYGDNFQPALFSPQLLTYFIELIKYNLDIVRATPYNEKLYEMLSTYLSYILKAMEVLPEDDLQQKELYKRYQLNDPNGYENFEDSSGYNPFSNLLYSKVPERFKVLADSTMQQIILSERQGFSKPRYEWEDALRCYIDILQRVGYSKLEEFPYSKQLYASQLQFLLDLDVVDKKQMVPGYMLGKLFRILSGDKYRSLRHKLSRFAALENTDRFSSFHISKEALPVANQMLEEFSGIDSELAERLQTLLIEYERSKKESLNQKSEREKVIQAALEAMK